MVFLRMLQCTGCTMIKSSGADRLIHQKECRQWMAGTGLLGCRDCGNAGSGVPESGIKAKMPGSVAGHIPGSPARKSGRNARNPEDNPRKSGRKARNPDKDARKSGNPTCPTPGTSLQVPEVRKCFLGFYSVPQPSYWPLDIRKFLVVSICHLEWNERVRNV